LGGVTGAVLAGFLMEDIHPKWGFLTYAIFGGILGICCLFLDKEAEIETNEGEEEYVSHWSSNYIEGQLSREAAQQRKEYYDALPKKGEEGCCRNTGKNFILIWRAL
jgi:hypothetical protein